MLKTVGIPMWVTIFALIVFVLGCGLGLVAMFDQGAMLGQGVVPSISASWGGRSLGLGLAAGVAVFLKSPIAYMAAFAGGLGRDLGDLIAELSKSETSIGVTAGIVVFFVAGVLGIMAANKARNL